ncbi:hypothetical protein [Rhizobium rhizogenes]|uniref:hypothetical protein n=1 Tax=Rhizobium rhizogenes TaxID=359 RepID=UPI001572944C|nr:hypothetical protein [Rhizobium rhizogenes]NTG64706.1 hypothetical protein [Rhizobium rhizogenes]NTH68429.1 hypothetical protein [Rhizobium rhizogenes]NTH99908.1 hypothetical protein [Rhizobium rhizogenes]NTI39058.1 hypothetical protein [Rhizobium rhizogenes]NTJ18200.1 hypothetical protein [Rhizobium rhizogenes]
MMTTEAFAQFQNAVDDYKQARSTRLIRALKVRRAAEVADAPAGSISNDEAWEGMVAEAKAIAILGTRTSDPDKLLGYSRQIDLLRRKYNNLANLSLAARQALYAPDDEIAAAADSLKATAKEAGDLADTLTTIAKLMGAITKFIGAI